MSQALVDFILKFVICFIIPVILGIVWGYFFVKRVDHAE